MDKKGPPGGAGGWAQPQGQHGMPSAPPSYNQAMATGPTPPQQYGQQPYPPQQQAGSAPYPTSSGAPPYYQNQSFPRSQPYPGQDFQQAGGPQGYPKSGYPGQQQQPYPQQGGAQFDAGARFSPYSPPTVPPPPPGVAPNSAQMARAQGQNVIPSQKKEGFWKGTGSGGYTFW